ncbi:MAG: isoprenylcysteine carboxylmethyltransferase family protein [Azospirillaceae bacterium]
MRPLPRITLALVYGTACHALFATGVGTMMVMMAFGMSRSLGAVPAPWSILANAALLAQFALGHSALLTRRGRGVLARLAPGAAGPTLAPTTYALIASIQVFALFALWTPSGVVWWRAEGAALAVMLALYAASWAILGKAILDAGVALQSGALGWVALLRDRRPRYPDMPERGLFRLTRQPIYVGFALTLWTVPVWTPDQLAVALALTAYCVLGPRLKERRFAALFGDRFEAYRARVPYWLPLPRPKGGARG